jgi:peptide-methionine (S)-S-oxide reductase
MFGSQAIPSKDDALPGRPDSMPVPDAHCQQASPHAAVSRRPRSSAVQDGLLLGRRKIFWQIPASTACGWLRSRAHAEPTYQEVCTGMTGHNEVVLVIFVEGNQLRRSPQSVLGESITQGMRQGHDSGTQCRSVSPSTKISAAPR